MTAPLPPPTVRRTLRVTGQVQGVGFRPFVYRLATSLGIAGSVQNDPAGVTIEAEGAPGRLDELAARIAAEAPALACVDAVAVLGERPPQGGGQGFCIVASDARPAARGRVTVDAATCPDCVRELFDPHDRRYRHGLVNCTSCGPRYTIVRDLPYDRPLTTMAGFAMCAACAAEYGDPADRRFHAQPVCCPRCGPRLALLAPDGGEVHGDPTREAARRLLAGGTLAMKGLGGYHLVVDATDAGAVGRLRSAKRRDDKPFALMVADVAAARALVDLSRDGEAALVSTARPIVLAPRRREDDGLAPGVAPANHRLGLMLPGTPMQHLLLAEVGRPLVMTSANESDDPLVSDDAEALRRLAAWVDAFLVHDRPIERAVDDGVVVDTPRGVIPLRRARGEVPAPLPLPVPAPRPGLAVGGELKSTVAVVREGAAIVSQHLGDLTWSLAYERFERTIADLERLFDVDVGWIACDAHPDYLSAAYARRRARLAALPLLVVQHHHAHLAAVLADHDRRSAAIGLACDGVGWGHDGTAWGGEVLVGDLVAFQRHARLRPLRLPGGDAAARETGRPALAWLWDLLGQAAERHPAAARALPDAGRRRAVASLLARDVRCPPSSGLGRLFDATAALLGVCLENRHEAMSGMRLEALAARADDHPSGDGLIRLMEAESPAELDTRPLLQALLDDIARGRPPPAIAWRFHDAVADGFARGVCLARHRSGLSTVALGGGVFANALLVDRLVARLERDGFEVLLPRAVPPNDGAIAYGQAAVAAARLAAR